MPNQYCVPTAHLNSWLYLFTYILAPKSDPDEINKLDSGWKEPLDHIFSTHIPIVIGYGGNDGSLMSYFEGMNKPSNFFWCGLDEKNISKRIESLIEKHDGSFIRMQGFDELLHELLWVFDEIKPIKEELNDITSQRINIATKQLEEIFISNEGINKRPQVISEKKELSALEYSNLADKEPDLEKRKQIYLEALEKYPTTEWLWANFTYFLHFIKKDFSGLEALYQKALDITKNHKGIVTNYALFLQNIKKDYVNAEEYFLKALTLDPKNSINNYNYAVFFGNHKKGLCKSRRVLFKSIGNKSQRSV